MNSNWMDHVQKQHFKFKSSPFKVFLKILPSVQVLGPEEKDENEYFLS